MDNKKGISLYAHAGSCIPYAFLDALGVSAESATNFHAQYTCPGCGGDVVLETIPKTSLKWFRHSGKNACRVGLRASVTYFVADIINSVKQFMLPSFVYRVGSENHLLGKPTIITPAELRVSPVALPHSPFISFDCKDKRIYFTILLGDGVEWPDFKYFDTHPEYGVIDIPMGYYVANYERFSKDALLGVFLKQNDFIKWRNYPWMNEFLSELSNHVKVLPASLHLNVTGCYRVDNCPLKKRNDHTGTYAFIARDCNLCPHFLLQSPDKNSVYCGCE